MNYWPSLVTNLGDADLQSPLWDLIGKIHQNGLNISEQMYGVNGAVAHHNTDLWGDAAPQDNYISSTFWNGGLTWLSTHIWEYYLFSGDVEVLRQSYSIFADVATYYINFVTPYKGWKVNNPSLSCENEYYPFNSTVPASITAGATLDNSLIKAIFGIVLEAQSILGISDDALKQGILSTQAQLPPFQISSFGGIQEWIEDYREQDPGHRREFPYYAVSVPYLCISARVTRRDRMLQIENSFRANIVTRLQSSLGLLSWRGDHGLEFDAVPGGADLALSEVELWRRIDGLVSRMGCQSRGAELQWK